MSKSYKPISSKYIAIDALRYSSSVSLKSKIDGMNSTISGHTTTINTLKTYYVTEVGSNSNGNYIKYNNGIMICYGSKTFSNLNVTSAWGSMYECTVNLGSFPVSFIESPHIAVSCSGGTTVFVEALNVNATSIGNTWFMRPVSTSGLSCSISYIAIGKWK